MVFKHRLDMVVSEHVWEWCKNVWYSNCSMYQKGTLQFENDVKMYGIQTLSVPSTLYSWFENDVKMYGIQTTRSWCKTGTVFENDVKMYGIQTQENRR